MTHKTKTFIIFVILAAFSFALRSPAAAAGTTGPATDVASQAQVDQVVLTGLLELPFLLIAVFFAFRTASALKGGVFGRGMLLIAAGALVMAVGHLHMQIQAMWGVNIFGQVFGNTLGTVVWVIALIITWGLTGAGFYSIYKSSKTN